MSVARTTELSVCIVVIKWKRTSRARDVRWTCKTAEYCAVYGDLTHMVKEPLLRSAVVNEETPLFCISLQAPAARG
jgi:hypothetical protein